MSIHGNIVVLRAPDLCDLDTLHTWSNSREIWSQLVGWHFPYSRRSTEHWIRNRNDNDQSNQVFAIDTAEGELIGTINLVNIDWKNRSAFHGIMIGNPAARGQGYALDAVMTIMRYAFDELGLERLDTSLIDYNERSRSFYTRKCGWAYEGVRRRAIYRNGQYHDLILIGILRAEYQCHADATRYWSPADAN
jgi:RimJ/RimL family protein N-acetyltransferase